MSRESKNSGGGLGIIIIIVLVVIAYRNYSSNEKNDITEAVEQIVDKVTKYSSDQGKIVKKIGIGQEGYKRKFLEDAHKFYDLYLEELGDDFTPDDEFDNEGKYLGNHEEVCLQLGDLLKAMCENYRNVSKKSEREALLEEMFNSGSDDYESGFEIYRYITNIGQIVIYVTGDTWYNDELFVIELNDAIIY